MHAVHDVAQGPGQEQCLFAVGVEVAIAARQGEACASLRWVSPPITSIGKANCLTMFRITGSSRLVVSLPNRAARLPVLSLPATSSRHGARLAERKSRDGSGLPGMLADSVGGCTSKVCACGYSSRLFGEQTRCRSPPLPDARSRLPRCGAQASESSCGANCSRFAEDGGNRHVPQWLGLTHQRQVTRMQLPMVGTTAG